MNEEWWRMMKNDEEWWRMNEERWKMKDEWRKMKDEGWMMEDDDLKLFRGFADGQTDGRTDERTDICDCRVAFATEKYLSANIPIFPIFFGYGD